jgi:hypothetical protein
METEKRITRAHLRSIFEILQEKNIIYLHLSLCMEFSNNRTGNDFEMTLQEAQNMIKYIKANSADQIISNFQITPGQNKLLHVLLAKTGLIKYKADLCASHSNNRTEHSSGLTKIEANNLIQYLKDNNECEVMIKRVWHLGYISNIIYGESKDDLAINAAKLDLFLKQRGTVKKPLRQQNIDELYKTLRQFESIASKAQEKRALNLYIQHFESKIQDCIALEKYEQATKHKKAIESAKLNPKLAISGITGFRVRD